LYVARLWNLPAYASLKCEQRPARSANPQCSALEIGPACVANAPAHHAGRRAGAHCRKEAIMKSTVLKRSIVISGHKTSISLEDPFWSGLKEIAKGHKSTLSSVVAQIESSREYGNLSSAIRLFVLEHTRAQPVSAENQLGTVAIAWDFPQVRGAG
jgi:predicted DNA-binding ribbon-helix-helix protein